MKGEYDFNNHTKDNMFLVVDLIVIIVLGIYTSAGYKKGLTRSLLWIVSFLLALIIALVLCKPVSNIVVDKTQFDENIKTSIVEVFEKEETDTQSDEKKSPLLDNIYKEIENATEEKKNEIIDNSATHLSKNIIKVCTFIVLFIVAKIAIRFVDSLARLISKLPLIKQADKIGGVIFGFLQGLLILFITFAIISLVSAIVNQYAVQEIINKSYLGSILFNNNIILILLF